MTKKTEAAAPKAAPDRIDLSPAELEGFAALRREEVALANRITAAARGVLASRGCPPNEAYDAIRGPDGAVVAFVNSAHRRLAEGDSEPLPT